MNIKFFLLFIMCFLILTSCYLDKDPIPTDEPTPEPTPIPWSDETKLTAIDGETNDNFGNSVSISGDYAIVGAPNDELINSGSAYIFNKNGTIWTVNEKIVASDGGNSNLFGHSVSISGNYCIIGAMVDGSAYIFHKEGTVWNKHQILLPAGGAGFFGCSVGISGDYAIVGAPYDDDNGYTSGSAFIFMREGTTWIEQQKLLPEDGAGADEFGFSVSISGNYAVVGAYQNDDFGTDSGSAYIFKRKGTSWIEQQKLLANDGAPDDQYGYVVSISGNYALIGAPYNEDYGFNTGAAYIFVQDGTVWTERQKITAQDNGSNDLFGISVSISGDCAVIGALDDDNGTNSGAAYIFE